MIQALVTYLESTEDIANFAKSGYGKAFAFGNMMLTKDAQLNAEVATDVPFEKILTQSLLHNLNIGQTVYMLPKGSEEVVKGKVAFLGRDGFITGPEDRGEGAESRFVKYSDFGISWFVDEATAKVAFEEGKDE